MKNATWIVGTVLVAVACDRRQEIVPANEPKAEERATPAAQVEADPPKPSHSIPTVAIPGVATCEPEARVSASVSRMIDFADSNSDGRVSKDEAKALANFLVGGFLFRADANMDGSVTPEESRRAGNDFIQQSPDLAALISTVQAATGTSPFAAVARLLDLDTAKPVSAAEVRGIAQGAVDDLFRVADKNSDAALTLGEARDASWEGARAVGRSAFEAADRDDDSRLTLVEFRGALDAPAQAAFTLADADGNGGLTLEESATALHHLVKRVGVPLRTVSVEAKRQ